MSLFKIFGNGDRGCVCVLSGGLDSTIALSLASRHFTETHAISFIYGQKQSLEIERAKETAKILNIPHRVIDIGFLGDIVRGVSSNIQGSDIVVPSIKDVLGSPQPVTYVPNRNSILFNIAAAYAESNGLGAVVTGLQTHDTYGYYDTTPHFVKSINDVWVQNRKNEIELVAPFINMSKREEIETLITELGVEESLACLKNTLTCYNPNDTGVSCGKCPSCSERIYAFMQVGIQDPIEYAIKIDWELNGE